MIAGIDTNAKLKEGLEPLGVSGPGKRPAVLPGEGRDCKEHS
jgi:hypothetical protein